MDKILNGIRHFNQNVFGSQREMFEDLAAKQQRPIALFITCSDSRINPNLITQTEPGELFILRNAGNIIPPYGAAFGGEGATIEYAISVLGMRNVIVCGHYHCGAMSALLQSERIELPAVRKWFAHAETTRRIVEEQADLHSRRELEALAVEQNVLTQIDNLRTHPCVATGLAKGTVELFAWVYKIETGEVLAYDSSERHFVSLTDSSPAPLPSMPLPKKVARPSANGNARSA